MDKSVMDSASYPPADDNENSLKSLLKQQKNEQTTFSGGGLGNGGSSVTTRSQQRAAAASKSNEIITARRQQIDAGGVGCLYKGHHYQQSVVKTEPCTNVANNDNAKVLCLPLHQTTPDTTGSPEGQPEYSLKRRAEDTDNAEVHHPGGGSSHSPLPRPRTKRPRRMYTPDQVQVLEKMFMNNEYPTAQDRVLLSAVTQLSTEKVKVWFQNRRSRERRRRQNQLHNTATMKRMSVAPAVNPKPPPCFTLSHPTVSSHGLTLSNTLSKTFSLTHPSTARSITPPPAPSQQQLAQAFTQTANYAFTHQMQTDINNNSSNNNNNNNANINTNMGVAAQPTQFIRPAMANKLPFGNMYARLCPSSVQPATAAGSSMDTKESAVPMSKPADTYTPLVPAWSQTWPMFPAAPQSSPQLQKMMPMDDFCDNNNRWVENPTTNLHSSVNYGIPGTGSTNNQNKPGGFQDHYPYAAMIPAGYLPYGYPYYPPGMYQNPQMGLYPQQHVPPVSATAMPPYLGGTDNNTVATTTKAFPTQQPPMMGQSVRLALQRKLDNTQKCYNWHYQSPGPPQTTTRLVEPSYLASQQQQPQSKGDNNNDALSDSSTLSSPERTSSPIKPLATSSPNSNHPVGCEVPFSMGDDDKGIDNNTMRMQDLWPQSAPHEQAMAAEGFDKNNNANNIMDIVVPTPYPNVAGYYNDFTPPTSSSYSQSTTTPWGNVKVNHISTSSPSYGYKLNPDWPITTTTSADRYSSADIPAQHMEEPHIRCSSSSGCYQYNLSDPGSTMAPSECYSPQVDPGHLSDLSATPNTNNYHASSPPINDEVMRAATGGSTGYSDISGGDEEQEEEGRNSRQATPQMAPPPPPAPAVQVPLPVPMPAPTCSEANGNDVHHEALDRSSGAASATSSHAVYVLSDTE